MPDHPTPPDAPDPDALGPGSEGGPGDSDVSRAEAPHGAEERDLDAVLDVVLDLPPDERVDFVRHRYDDRPGLRDRLLRLLEASEAGAALLFEADRAAQGLLADETSGTGRRPDRSRRRSRRLHGRRAPPAVGRPRELLERIGSGGMGTVYLARRRDGDIERRVALKVVGGAVHRPDVRRRFVEERRMLSRLEHPNIARLYDVGVDERGVPYFVMEYIDGLPIDTYADRNHLGVEARVRLVLQVTDALACAHRNLIVHRDVKPSNLLVTPDGRVKLLDFGVAKLLEDPASGSRPLTRPGLPVLTPEYASPEQIRGEAVTTASDVYATGILLYELLAGTRPYTFTSRSPIHIERVVSQQEPRPPSTVAAELSPDAASLRQSAPAGLARQIRGDLDAIVLTALRKEPGRRYGSVQDLAADLRRYGSREPVRARPPTWTYRAGRFVLRNRLPVAAAALVLLALGTGLTATLWQAREARREAERAERVVALLSELFQGADPDVAGGEPLTAEDLLTRGEERLLAGLEGEPQVAARLQRVVAELYTSLGAYDRAGPLLDSALALVDRHGGPLQRAAVQAERAELLHATGRWEEGERIAREVLEVRRARARRPGRSVDVAAAITDLAAFINDGTRFDEKEALIRDALRIDRAAGATEFVATDLNNLGTMLMDAGRYDESIAALEESLGIRAALYPDGHTDLATSQANLAEALSRRGDYERADTLFERALDLRRTLLREDHPLVAILLNNQASMRATQGRLAEARGLHEEALRIRRAAFGDEHEAVAGSLNNLAIVSYREEDHGAAEARMREALRVFRAIHSEDHPDVLTAVGNLGAILWAQGALEQAEGLIRQTLETRIRVLGPDHHNTGGAWNNLGGVLRRQGRFAEAEGPILRAVEIFRAALDPDHPDLVDGLLNLGRTLVELGRAEEALPPVQEACTARQSRYESGHVLVADCLGLLGIALVAAGRAGDARVPLEAAVEVLEEARPGADWTLRARGALDGLSGSPPEPRSPR